MAPLQQSPAFARALTAIGVQTTTDPAVILTRRLGPLGRVSMATRCAPDAVANSPVRILNGETTCPRAYRTAGFRQIITPAHIAEWDLTAPDLRAGLHGKWRNRLVKAEASGLRVRIATWDGTPHVMFEHAAALARKRRYRSYPTALLSAFAQISPSDAQLLEAYDRGTLVAACLILRHGDTATYQTAWSTATGRALQAPRLLLWTAAVQMIKLGHTLLDLGTVETDRSAGLARFKLGTGAQARALGGTWVRVKGGKPLAPVHTMS